MLYENTITRSSSLDKTDKIQEAYEKMLSEASKIMTVDEFIKGLESVIKKSFPKSFVKVQASGNLGTSIFVTFALGKDKSEWQNGIIHNDPLHHQWMIGFNSFTENAFIKDKIEAELSVGGSLTIQPEEGSHLALGRAKIGWRKKTAPPEKLIPYFGNYFKKVKKVLVDNKENLTEYGYEIAKKKI